MEDFLDNPIIVPTLTKLGRKYEVNEKVAHKAMKDPKVWEVQEEVRQGCLKEIHKKRKEIGEKKGVTMISHPYLEEKGGCKSTERGREKIWKELNTFEEYNDHFRLDIEFSL